MANPFSSLGKAVGKIAPGIASMLGSSAGGPIGSALASDAVKGVAKALGVKTEAPEALLQALEKATPRQLEAIRAADHDFQVQMRKLGLEEEAIHHKDRLSARGRETLVGGRTTPALAAVTVAGFVGTVAVVLWLEGRVDSSLGDSVLAGAVVGYISAKADQVISYYFGSSSTSDEMIKNGKK